MVGMSASPHRNRSPLLRISNLDAHHRLIFSLVMALICYAIPFRHLSRTHHLFLSWDVFTLCVLGLAGMRILTAQPRDVLHAASLQHSSRTWIFLFVLASACASLAAVFLLLPPARSLSTTGATGHIALALATVLLSWALIHTIFTLHYAYLYYCRHPETGSAVPALIFPGGTMDPDYNDFAYFSFVIGMTSQVTDVGIGSKEVRRWVLLHSIISFAFNTAVLALGINIASGLFAN